MTQAHPPPSLRPFWAIVLAGLIFLSLSLWLDTAARQHLSAETSAAKAYQIASAVAAIGRTQATNADPRAPQMGLSNLMAELNTPGANARLIDLDGRRLLASTDAADLALSPAPRTLLPSEKPLYDRGKALNRAPNGRLVLTHSGTGAAAATVAITGPDGRTWGAAEASIAKPPGAQLGPSWILLAGLLIAIGAAAFVGRARLGRNAGAAALIATAALAMLAVVVLPADFSAAQASNADAIAAHGEQTRLAMGANAAPAAPLPADAFAPQAAMDLRWSLLAAGLFALSIAAFVGFGAAASVWRAMRAHRTAYAYLAPAMIGMLALSIFPFLYGVSLSVTNTTLLNQDAPFLQRFVGLENYAAILGDFQLIDASSGQGVVDYSNFYWTLFMTVLWTVTNVAIGVTVGLALALLLNTKGLKFAPIYRTLLILPWAIPNYITALIWKGIFHPQFGAANQVVQAFGGEPVAWFNAVWPSFFTGVMANGWLSFPFMMVVCLGALQAIDEDMYEAAKIDGASPWQRFRYITLPSLAPALIPAIIVSVVWTFNMFNVIYLVSAGQPGGSTEILVTRAYKVAFEEYRYGYAAAYSVVIFLILLIYSGWQLRVTKSMETAR